jgi:hypothetical protein
MITPEQQKIIDGINQMPHFDMCKHWRFAPPGDSFFDPRLPYHQVFRDRLFGHFHGFTPEISKALGV